ncbi:zinc finger protein [Macleaya cordata]|uniref:Zinc finger protein n=1 Tax=Macleaya cordata TaxID=56857 RepID=A0A200Q3F7_MACCD|nr:zinc finger protein [Macleaya cordata]
MNISDKKAANAVGGKTARACDSCMCKRARWYCTADDAFLCQACDASVHSANSLARRHERVRLKTSSMKPTEKTINSSLEINSSLLPTWHQGFRRKARTPRHGKPMLSQQPPKADDEEPILMNNNNPHLPHLVPEIGSDETSPDENEEQLLYRVPIFDPFVAEFCTSVMANEVVTTPTNEVSNTIGNHNSKILLPEYDHVPAEDFENLSCLNLPSDMDLTEFAADVETLLGRGLDEDSFGMEGLGLLDSKEEEYYCFGSNTGRVKEEAEEDEELEAVVACHLEQEFDMSRETLDLNFDYDSPTTGEEEEEKVVNTSVAPMMMMMMMNDGVRNKSADMTTKSSISLRLNYEAVIAAWASQGGSPWTTGDRPPFNPDDCWPECLGTCHPDVHHHHGYGDMAGGVGGGGGGGGHVGMIGDGGREARVSRYREKRRTRLFSKKIRYEVRKLNAEKRPRMKGRFVKRTSSSSSSFMGSSATTALPF